MQSLKQAKMIFCLLQALSVLALEAQSYKNATNDYKCAKAQKNYPNILIQ